MRRFLIKEIPGIDPPYRQQIPPLPAKIWWKTAIRPKTFGGKRQFSQKHLVGIEYLSILASLNR